MKGMLSWIAAAGLLAAPPAQAQDADVVFRPSGQWTADYGEDYCRLIRTFSDGQREFSLALERLQPGAWVRLIVVGEGMRPFRGAEQVAFQFEPTGASGKARYVRSETSDGKQFVSFDPITLAQSPALTPTPGNPPAPPPMYSRAQELATAREITGFRLSEGLMSPVRVETGSLRAAIEALQVCADDLLGEWGLDAEKHKTMTALPILDPDPQGVLPQGTVPFGDFGKLGGGANEVRLMVGADGKVTSCAIYSPSLSPSLNERICQLAKERASFQPAKDADGQPMASVWMGSPLLLGPPFPGGRGPGRRGGR
ncbi:MAG TPA: hypothetical protein VFS49_10940 [Croceibacterium sp.]|nr:hypothetical protein [Croceibacterium sp.]